MSLRNHLKTRFLIDEAESVSMLWIMFLCTLRYYLVVISQGQTDSFAALLLALLVISYAGKKQILSGVIFAAILQIKPYFAPLVFLFIFEKRYKTFFSFLISILFFAALPSVFLGLRETYAFTKDWLGIMGMSLPSQVLNYKNQSLSYGGALAVFKFTGISVLKAPEALVFYLSVFLTGMSMLIFFLRAKYLKARDSSGLWGYFSLSFMMTVMVVFSPISWEAYYMVLIIPLAVFFIEAVKTGRERSLAAYLAAYFIVTLSSGTDITKFIPVLNETRYLNVSSGAVIVLAGMFHLYLGKKRGQATLSRTWRVDQPG